MNRRKDSSAQQNQTRPATNGGGDLHALPAALAASALDEKLRKALETLGELIESNVTAAVMSLIDRNVAMAIDVIETHIEIEAQLVVVDSNCRRALVEANDETVARHIFAAICNRSEMAHIADEARDFAREVLFLTKKTAVGAQPDFARLFEWVERLMRDANRVAIHADQDLAKIMLQMEPTVENECRVIIEQILQMDNKVNHNADFALYLVMALQHLRSIARSAGKIAQAAVYLKEGRSLKTEYDLPYSSDELAALRRAATIE
ncbi:MAG: PhoU domain-containing protein [Planctomycetota bacterium]